MKIVGITGTSGAGKGTIVDYLVKEKRYIHLSVRQYLTDELEKKGLEINRDNMRELANKLREENGAGYIMQQLYLQAIKSGENCIIESIRCVGEIDTLKDIARESGKEFILLGVDANPKIRYERIKERNSETDKVPYERFLEQERSESISEDPAKQNLPKCLELSDKIFINEGSIADLEYQIEQYLTNPETNTEIVQKN
jgi:dephospho-CoA kinase